MTKCLRQSRVQKSANKQTYKQTKKERETERKKYSRFEKAESKTICKAPERSLYKNFY